MVYKMFCVVYVDMFGLIIGDKLCFVDIDLIVEVEKDFIIYGEEVKFGGGKVICDGMGQSQELCFVGVVDIVIINVLIIDYWGIVKVDVGLCDGCIVGIGKVGNLDVQFGVDIVVGLGMEVIVGEGKILIVGVFDVYIYFICFQQIDEVLMFGVMIMLGGGMGLVIGINVIMCMFGFWYIICMLQFVDSFLMNFVFVGKGNVSLFVVFEE